MLKSLRAELKSLQLNRITKGQFISKCPFGVFILTQKPQRISLDTHIDYFILFNIFSVNQYVIYDTNDSWQMSQFVN